MPRGVSRNPRTDKRRVKNRISKVKPSKAEPNFVEVGPPMTFSQAMNSIRERTVKEDTDMIMTNKDIAGLFLIDFIEANRLNYHLGMVVMCITCDDHKHDPLEHLKKAQWHLNREIENRSKK